MNNFATFTKLRPVSLLRNLSNCSDTTCVVAESDLVTWSIYIEQGTITYATHSVEPFDRLERHLRRFSYQIPTLKSEVRVQLRMLFEPDSQIHLSPSNDTTQLPDYQAICWLVSQKYLNPTQASVLIQELTKEVIESFLLIRNGIYQFQPYLTLTSRICRLDGEKIVQRCQEKLQNLQSMAPQISSPYQRPYLIMQPNADSTQLPEIQQKLAHWMKGFSLRHLAVIMNQDEVQLCRSLYPYILKGAVLLHAPDPPFDKLPKIFDSILRTPNYATSLISNVGIETKQTIQTQPDAVQKVKLKPSPDHTDIVASNQSQDTPLSPPSTSVNKKIYKIVSVDDSPTMLKEISRFLEDESFTVVTINNPLKAVMSIIRHQPDLILLDLNMDEIDGYELCRIIRNNSKFQNTPVIMVTGNKGFVDKVKARLVGASGYLTKPFTRADLLKIVFTHLV